MLRKNAMIYQGICENIIIKIKEILMFLEFSEINLDTLRVNLKLTIILFGLNFNSFMTEVAIKYKPVHWFALQINGLVSI